MFFIACNKPVITIYTLLVFFIIFYVNIINRIFKRMLALLDKLNALLNEQIAVAFGKP